MSSNNKTTSTIEEAKPALLPKLRFPEFRHASSWTTVKLGAVATISTQKAGNSICVPMSITTGVGLVSQEEKFGRVIAGESYKNYLLLKPNDFAYNKSATKEYPEGFLTLYTGNELAAVPNSIFTCFRINGDSPDVRFLNYQFSDNLHGRWLRKFIQVGARANGSLSINDSDLMALPVPLPVGATSVVEQQKIADCLSSLDELITAQARKVDALKTHKKGLMQQLFPREGETQPRLRFPDFQNAGKWEGKTLNDIAKITSGSTPSRSNPEFFTGGSIPWVKTTDLNNSFIVETEEKITSKAKARINPAGSVLIAMYGGFNQIGRTGCLSNSAATNQAISVLVLDRKAAVPAYVLAWLNAKVEVWRRIASSSRKDPNITGSDVAKFSIVLPELDEQQRIASCLSSLDDVITAETQQLEALKTLKKGLMQQLHPARHRGHAILPSRCIPRRTAIGGGSRYWQALYLSFQRPAQHHGKNRILLWPYRYFLLPQGAEHRRCGALQPCLEPAQPWQISTYKICRLTQNVKNEVLKIKQFFTFCGNEVGLS
ncbi:restriction endonuclease subunit S [Aquitalea sp.]|uniref:restriction endonuclease subunit S n=1 Tax=Aquitalea sp. TaxID=1872623 RepID=UPI002586A52C|nr:restriction endonuclease subunit S [Aquitalea sp.]